MRYEYDTVIDYKGHRMEVVYHFYNRVPERGPSHASGGEPGEPAYAEVLSADLISDDDELVWVLTDAQCSMVNNDERAQEQMIAAALDHG